MSKMNKAKKNNGRLRKHFGSRKVFVTYLICLAAILFTMILSVISTLLDRADYPEKTTEHIGLCLQAIIFLFIPVFMRSKLRFHIPSFMQIVVAIFIVAHCVLGEIYRFYDYLFLFDKVLHTTAGVIIALLGFSVVYGFSRTDSGMLKLSPFFVALFSFCFTVALLTLWEVFEYSMDTIFSTNMQRWQDSLTEIEIDGIKHLVTTIPNGNGLVDTMSDLIVGIVGATVICFLGGILVKKYPNNTMFFVTKIRPAKNKKIKVGGDENTDLSGTYAVDEVKNDAQNSVADKIEIGGNENNNAEKENNPNETNNTEV